MIDRKLSELFSENAGKSWYQRQVILCGPDLEEKTLIAVNEVRRSGRNIKNNGRRPHIYNKTMAVTCSRSACHTVGHPYLLRCKLGRERKRLAELL